MVTLCSKSPSCKGVGKEKESERKSAYKSVIFFISFEWKILNFLNIIFQDLKLVLFEQRGLCKVKPHTVGSRNNILGGNQGPSTEM